MLPRPRSVDCDVKPSFGQLQDETYVSQQCLNQYSSTGESQAIRHITALLDELFLVLYEPKEMAKLKVKPLHYSIQVPMRLRRLPKSFFIPPFNQQQPQPRPFVENSSLFSGKHAYHQHPRIKSHGPSVASGQHVQYCCSSKGATPTGTSLGPGESKGNNILFSRSNNHISFIEGHQYDARMYASIEVTATTLKYQKRLQLPSPSTHQQTLTGALKSTTNGSFLSTPGNRSNWDSTFPPTNAPYPMHSGPSQPNSWLNYARAPGQGQPYDDSDESSGTEQSEHNDKTTQSTSATGDYLDLDGFDGGIEFPPPTSALGVNVEAYGGTIGAVEQPFVAYQGAVTKPLVSEFAHPVNYPTTAPPPPPFSQSSLEHLMSSTKESLEHPHLNGTFEQLAFPQQPPTFNPGIVSPFGSNSSAWNGNIWN